MSVCEKTGVVKSVEVVQHRFNDVDLEDRFAVVVLDHSHSREVPAIVSSKVHCQVLDRVVLRYDGAYTVVGILPRNVDVLEYAARDVAYTARLVDSELLEEWVNGRYNPDMYKAPFYMVFDPSQSSERMPKQPYTTEEEALEVAREIQRKNESSQVFVLKTVKAVKPANVPQLVEDIP